MCLLEDECRDEVMTAGNLSLIHGISHARQHHLHNLGISNISELSGADCRKLSRDLYDRFGTTPGEVELFRMQLHARAIATRKPVFFGDAGSLSFLRRPLVVMDLEYDPESYIWLAGLCVSDGNRPEYQQFFAERFTASEEKRILRSVHDFLEAHPIHPVITFGTSADMPQLRKAWMRQGMPESGLDEIERRNIEYTPV